MSSLSVALKTQTVKGHLRENDQNDKKHSVTKIQRMNTELEQSRL